MSNAVGLRDQRARLYARSNVGDDGRVRPTFTFTEERWVRIDTASVAVRAMAERVGMRLDAVATFADEAVVPIHGVLTQGGAMWWIRGITPVRQSRCQVVALERIAEEEVATFALYEGVDVLDGVHLVEP